MQNESENRPLQGKTALVTGSSSGIGRAIAIALARAGADVHLHARSNQPGLNEVRQQLARLGSVGRDFLCDLSLAEQYELFVEQAFQAGPVDVWVNNAGVDVLTGAAAECSFERKLEMLWEVDVRATLMLSRLAGQRMKQQAGGAIINIGWDQADHGMEGDSGEMFATAKGAIAAASRSLAKSLAPDVRVCCLAPGWIRTKWGEHASDYWDRRARAESLCGRWGTPEDVGAAAVFLASPAASFTTGITFPVNGGFAGPYREGS